VQIMATRNVRQGPVFGDDRPVQRNKETTNPDKPNRSPGESNAARRMPSVREDFVKSASKDIERVGKGLEPTGKSALTRSAQQNAAGRAILRTAGRVGYGAAALEVGYAAGREIDKHTGVGKEIVEGSGLGKVVDRAVNMRDKVELTKEAKDRLAKKDEPEQASYSNEGRRVREPAVEKKEETKAAPKKAPSMKEEGVREGSNKNIDDETRQRAMKAAEFAKGGYVGAAHNVFANKFKK
jgi:hypothetical protein